MSNKAGNPVLVTGASGQLGSRVVQLLVDDGVPVIAATRNPAKIAEFGVEVRTADFDQTPEELAKAFAGARRMLLISTNAIDRPGHRYEQHQRAIDAAKRAGVTHIVYTSMTHPVKDSPVLIALDHLRTEEALAASGLGYTALRNNLYTDLLLMSLPAAIASGQLFAAAGDGGAAYVTREDCARAAAAALRADFDGKRQLEITGPAVVTYGELASLASELSGKEVAYVPVDEEALVAGMVERGLPEPVARLMASFDTGMKQGLFGPATGAVEELTGHKPTSVRAFLKANKGALTANRSS
jgi:NAD(P)H dehydrogenase (quinone)